jgi:hypothetical protein
MKFLAVLLVLFFVGCTKQDTPPVETKTETSTETITYSDSSGTALTPVEACAPGQYPAVITADGKLHCQDYPKPPARTPTAAELTGCPKPGEYQAFDRVGYSDQKFVDVMRHVGMDQIAIRYYDWKNESLAGKTPTAAELAVYKANGIPVVMVFQHLNNREATFKDASRPATDANRTLELARQWKQPKGSAIYFGYDGDFEYSVIKSYATKVAKIVRDAGYRVGMYGGGANCAALVKDGLVDKSKDKEAKPLCFIAASSWGWRGTKDMIATKNYVIHQKVNMKCAGKSIDFDKLLAKDVGQWSVQ